MDTIQSFTDLLAWKKAHALVIKTYLITKKFPKDELFSLTNQMRRAAVSVTSNIAEGFGRNTAKDKSQFYAIAKGSVFEIQSQYLIARDLEYITKDDYIKIENDCVEIQKIISGLLKSAIDR